MGNLTSMDTARYLIYLSYNGKKASLTPLKLQKLLYLSQGWSYVWDDKPLFNDDFEAWKYGPVNLETYLYFKKYHNQEIPASEGIDIDDCEKDVKETISAVWDMYSGNTAFELVNITHEQTPWQKSYSRGTSIRNTDIRKYFKAVYN